MKKLFFAIAFLSCAVSVFQARAQSVYRYEVEKVVEDIYVFRPMINRFRWVTSNIVVIINPDDVLVVDSGLLPAAATEAIKEIQKLTPKPVRYLVNTHWHGDHWQGNEAFAKTFPGLQIIATENGLKGILRNGMIWIREFYPKYLQMMVNNYEADLKRGAFIDGKPLTEGQMKDLKEGLELVRQDLEATKTIKPTPPNLTFSDKMILRLGSREIQFHYPGIGNTIGDAVIYLPNEKVLIPGDLVVYPSPYESGAFSKEWVETSRSLKNFEFTYLIPGHGATQKDSRYLDYLNALFAEVSKQIDEAYLSGKTTAEEASQLVTHASVVAELNKNPEFVEFAKRLDMSFVKQAVQNSFKRAVEGKL